MQSLGIHYYPLTLPFLLVLLCVLVALTFLAVLRVLQFAYSQLGIAPRYFFTWLFLSLAGSYVNLPIMRFAPEQMTRLGEVPFYGVPYVIPTVETWPGTILAVNVGGAIIPVLLSLVLIVKNNLYKNAIWGVLVVSLACYLLAEPVPGLGIAIPVFYPPVIGTALKHPHITTDFSEALIELITGVHTELAACLEEMKRIHQFVIRRIGDEVLWGASMPCSLPDENAIPIARYGTSNVGRA